MTFRKKQTKTKVPLGLILPFTRTFNASHCLQNSIQYFFFKLLYSITYRNIYMCVCVCVCVYNIQYTFVSVHSMAISASILLCSLPHFPVLIPPSSQPLKISILFSVSMHLITPGPSYKWNHTIAVLLGLVYST